MNDQVKSELIKRRGVVKAKLTRIHTFINNVANQSNHSAIRVRFETLSSIHDQYEEIQSRLEIEDTEADLVHEINRSEFEDLYFDINAKSNDLLAPITLSSDPCTSHGIVNGAQDNNMVKLPNINLPHFSGDYTRWSQYKDTYVALIHNNSSLTDVQKFHYLLSSLRDDPLLLIKNLPLSSANYVIAWEMILKRYENKKLISQKHVNTLLNLPHARANSAHELRQVVNELTSNLNAIQALNLNIEIHELLLIQLTLGKLDIQTRRDFETSQSESEFSTLKCLCDFLDKRAHTIELTQAKVDIPQSKPFNKHTYVTTNTIECLHCGNNHYLYNCKSFRDLSVAQRWQIIRSKNACANCFAINHKVNACKSPSYCKCGKTHSILLHDSKQGPQCQTQLFNKQLTDNQCNNRTPASVQGNNHFSNHSEINTSNASAGSYCSFKAKPTHQVLLATAQVYAQDKFRNLITCRALLDSASQASFITLELANKLQLKKEVSHTPIQGINNTSSTTTHTVNVTVKSTINNYTIKIDCFILPKITGNLPSVSIDSSTWNIPLNIALADPDFDNPGEVQLLIGAEHYYDILQSNSLTRPGFPTIQDTKLGWVLGGRVPGSTLEQSPKPAHTYFVSTENIDQQLKRFWEIESILKPIATKEEIECENHFLNNTIRNAQGRFTVRLPLKEDRSQLGDSRTQAMRRFQQLERHLNSNNVVKEDYNKFLHEYQELGHMQPVDTAPDGTDTCYFLPHHAVFKQSTTTRIRVVFDGSAKSNTGKSLNDLLKLGPTIQDDLCSIVLRFRTHLIAFSADIAKMYRQINVHPSDCNLQCILWRQSTNEPIREYQLTTVTYGTKTAPFLATRCLQHLADLEAKNYPKASLLLKNDFYVDDCLSGANNLEDALQLQQDLKSLLASGGFPLRKWCSNHSALLESVPEEDRETSLPLQLEREDCIKTLGLLWHPASDIFQINNGSTMPQLQQVTPATKRKVLSIVSAIFDPLGLISPIVINCKIFLQHLWLERLDWDDILPVSLNTEWQNICNELPTISNIKVQRLVLVTGVITDVQLHGFSDASEKAFGACIYLRSTNKESHTATHLLCSKSKVAPLKRITLPRLELCGALLLAKLFNKAVESLHLDINSSFLWTDSTLVLAWIKAHPHKWKTFIANRVTEIQELTANAKWAHVASAQNPADLISRGTSPDILATCKLWWHGPRWLSQDTSLWPVSNMQPIALEDLPEQKTTIITLIAIKPEDDIILKFSKLSKLQRVIAYCFRFCYNSRKPPSERNHSTLSAAELLSSLKACIKLAQGVAYPSEIHTLSTSKELSNKSTIKNLYPFLDNEGILRLGGRLQKSLLPFESKHQIIIPPRHHLTKLLIMHEHLRLLHASSQMLTSSLQQLYWIPSIRRILRSTLHQCLPCYKLKTSTTQQLMGELPTPRIQPARPFLNTGVDYAGPFFIKQGSIRSKVKLKAYIAIFVCLATKAVHIELVSDMTTEAFIAALKRFTSRRGQCSNIYSDNGTNFVGANHHLAELSKLLKSRYHQETLQNYNSLENCNWFFIPPRSPHFGGLWEAAVKSLKYHLRRVIGNNSLTFEQMSTILTQIEACLNSRPLIVCSNDPNDISYLSPGHFLIGEAITSIPEPNLIGSSIHALNRWQQLQQSMQLIWKKWSTDYLHTMQQRQKWSSSSPNLVEGTVVLVKEDNLPPLQWELAVITALHPGHDGKVRVVTIKTPRGHFKRPIVKLCPLPI